MRLVGEPAVVWHLSPSLPSPLNQGPLPMEAWLRDGHATVVKESPYRTVYRLRVGGVDCHLKEYRATGIRNRTRELLRPIKARSEFAKAADLVLRGIPVPEPLGWGVLGHPWWPVASFVLVRTVSDAEHLTLASRELSPARRQALAATLGQFFAHLHGAGITHHDIHPGNILVRWEGDRPALTLLDLHEVRLGRPLSASRRGTNMAVFNRYFMLRSTRQDRLRFWRACIAAAPDTVRDQPALTPASLERETLSSNRVLWRSRLGKYVGSSRLVVPVAGRTASGWAVAELPSDVLHRLGDDPDGMMRHRYLKAGGRSTVVATPWGVLKRFNIRRPVDRWKNWLRRSPELHAWIIGHALCDAGLPTARPLAVASVAQATGYLLTEELPDVVDLRAFVDSCQSLPAQQRLRVLRERAVPVARALRALHDRGFGHRDLKAGNLLTPAAFHDHRIWFVDMAGVRHRKRNSRAHRVRDLSRLLASFLGLPSVTPGLRLRFLLAYRGTGIGGKAGWRRWWRELGDSGYRIVADIRRRGRPVG